MLNIGIYAYMFMFVYELLLNIYLFICYAWVKGGLLWSFTLIHAYITPWALSSLKRGRLLAQRPFTLVLMMINSRSYSTNDPVFILFQIFDQDYSWCLASTIWFGSLHMLIQEPAHQRWYIAIARWIKGVFGSIGIHSF